MEKIFPMQNMSGRYSLRGAKTDFGFGILHSFSNLQCECRDRRHYRSLPRSINFIPMPSATYLKTRKPKGLIYFALLLLITTMLASFYGDFFTITYFFFQRT